MYYYSIKQKWTSELKIKKSKFRTTLAPVKTIQEVESILADIREHPYARRVPGTPLALRKADGVSH